MASKRREAPRPHARRILPPGSVPSISEEEFLEAAIAAEEANDRSLISRTRRSLRDPILAEAAGAFTADGAIATDDYCPGCGYHLTDYGCWCIASEVHLRPRRARRRLAN